MTKITTPDQASPRPLISRHVAVIGAGAARELVREGHGVVVFERGDQVGGTWVYNPTVESDPLGLDQDDDERDPRSFPGHREVLMYFKDFAKEFGVEELVRFQTQVVYVGMVESGNKWKVTSKKRSGDNQVEVNDVFDAAVVCVGHYSEPRLADIPGIDAWPGKEIHSHSYRIPGPFQDRVVVLIGFGTNATDISRDIAGVAKEVHVAYKSISHEKIGKQLGYVNIWLHSMIKSVHDDGSVVFHDESVVFADVIIHCTGYKYHFPFLETNGIVTVDDNRVGPLYKHVFPPALAPWLSFVGIPMKIIPFPTWELQSKWIAGILSNPITVPSEEDMMKDINSYYSMLEVSCTPKRYAHNISNSRPSISIEPHKPIRERERAPHPSAKLMKWAPSVRAEIYSCFFPPSRVARVTSTQDLRARVLTPRGLRRVKVSKRVDHAPAMPTYLSNECALAVEVVPHFDQRQLCPSTPLVPPVRAGLSYLQSLAFSSSVRTTCGKSIPFNQSIGDTWHSRYKYHFPFLETNGLVTEDDNCVRPLYKHVFPPALAPWLSFVIPFTVCELQCKWIAGVLSNRTTLPSEEDMMEDINVFYSVLEVSGIPKRYTHNLSYHQEIAAVAIEVHITSRSIADEKLGKHPVYDNMCLHSMIKCVNKDSSVVFQDESVIFADVILHCTGYKYHFPFLETNGLVTVDDNCVRPLYKHVFPPALAPWLSFVGLPMKVIPFTVCELQCKWIAGVLSNRTTLPSEEDMMEDINVFYSMLEVSGIPKRYTHNLAYHQFEYDDWLAVQCGCPPYEEWRKQIFFAVARMKHARPETFRDEWDYEDLILQAHHDFIKYLQIK
ncbi:Flavin-containing monooxygenase FMO GS-OX-like 3 [Morus notabilis]|uniref:Flavin-containing monooxygenase n=1 Tax=Morus notabilis TaxID=981085 RepID=W9SFS8_9ROSA|nr:Flavin-containing monooxygenase FMO GS-OX-like 3 [Morus notabilis]